MLALISNCFKFGVMFYQKENSAKTSMHNLNFYIILACLNLDAASSKFGNIYTTR
jgi:hypothetical protein